MILYRIESCVKIFYIILLSSHKQIFIDTISVIQCSSVSYWYTEVILPTWEYHLYQHIPLPAKEWIEFLNETKWYKYSFVNYDIIGSDKGLMPVWCQAIV